MADKTETPRKSGFDMRDVLALLGVCLISGGAWMIYPPAGLIAGGLILTAAAVFAARA